MQTRLLKRGNSLVAFLGSLGFRPSLLGLVDTRGRKKRQNRLGFIVAVATYVASAPTRQKPLLVLGRLEQVKRLTICSVPAAASWERV